MTRRGRVVAGAAAVTALVLATSVVAGATAVFRPHPTLDGDLRLLGLRERVEVVRDPYGVPHVFAANAHDLFFAQGYVTAQDRLWQMDLHRRAGAGRLAEVLGEPALEADKVVRTLGLARAAVADLALARPETRAALDAYAAGVNKFIGQHGRSLPLEFALLGYRPEEWQPADSTVIAKLQAFDLGVNYTTELLRAGIAQRLGTAALASLLPDAAPLAAVDEGSWAAVAPHFSPAIASPGLEALRAIVGDARPGLGSNCWAVRGERTASGRALLAGDPHLSVRNPSVWYENGLHGGGMDVVGFSIPGAPGVVIGHNDRVAWSFTVAYSDAQDLYVEQQDPADPRRYLFRGASEAATFHREEIRVKGRAEPFPLDVAVTRHGPIITSLVPGQKAQLALRWTALAGGRTLDAVLALDRARDWDSFRAALADFDSPTVHVCYADADGHVGYALAGALPDRAGGHDGRLPVPGWLGEHEWRGLVAPERNPSFLDPPGGLVVSANDRAVSERGAIGYDGEHDPGFRAARLRELLGPLRGATVERYREVQTDLASVPARRLRETILSLRPRSPLAAAAQALVREWDGELRADSAAAAVYEAWLVRMIERTFKDKLGDELYREYLTHGRYPVPALHALVARPDDPQFVELGTGVRGRDEIASLALEDAVRDLRGRLGAAARAWRWGDLHTVTFEHVMGPALPFLNIGPLRRGGDGYSVNSAAYRLARPFALRGHASLRMIVDFADLDASRAALPTGQSGQPFARHWGDQTALWASGDLRPMLFTRERLGRPEGRTLVLRPR